MKKNEYLERRKQDNLSYARAAEDIVRQMMCDTLTVTLNRDCGFGYDRITKVLDAWGERYNLFMNACDVEHSEADYLQEVLDRDLKYICRKHEFYPFKQRYPRVLDIDYKRRCKR